MVEPRFCETLQCFHHILGDVTLPESTTKQKTKPLEISCILAMKTRSTRIFQYMYLIFDFGTISGSIPQLIEASFAHAGTNKEIYSQEAGFALDMIPECSCLKVASTLY